MAIYIDYVLNEKIIRGLSLRFKYRPQACCMLVLSMCRIRSEHENANGG